MDTNKDSEFRDAQCSSGNDFRDSQDNNLKSHNEKRKAQDSCNNDLKDSLDINDLRNIHGTYEDYLDV